MIYKQRDLFKTIKDTNFFDQSKTNIVIRETHISLIILTGEFAYKFKKNLKLDFLDFTTLENRKNACENELILNQRYAKELYLDVVPVYFNGTSFSLKADGEIVDYAVKMKQFDEKQLFSNLMKKGQLTKFHLLELTESIVSFHKKAKIKESFWGVQDFKSLAIDNFTSCMQFSPPMSKGDLDDQRKLTESLITKNQALISSRQKTHVKALHGDLHLGNICIYQNKPQIFDGIEFNDKYSCCDTLADLAFLLMDLDEFGFSNYSIAVLNYYLELIDDFSGLALLNLYKSYRAMVRAKIACYKIEVDKESEKDALKYCNLSQTYLSINTPYIIAIGGLSGSGKSTLAKALSERISALVIRQDAVRKHIFKIPLEQKADDTFYSKDSNQKTKEAVIERLTLSIKSNLPVIIDSTFSDSSYRKLVEDFANKKGLRFIGIWCFAKEECVKSRLKNRQGDVSDANYEIYKLQKNKTTEPDNWHHINTDDSIDNLTKSLITLI